MKKSVKCVLLLMVSFNSYGHDVSELMKTCSVEVNALKRLACYDEISQNQLPEETTAPKSVASSSVKSEIPTETLVASKAAKQTIQTKTPVAAAKQVNSSNSPDADFGIKRISRPDDVIDAISAKVQTIKKDPYKKYVITLNNGQVWKQLDSTRLRISVGDTVIVKRGMMSNFFMGKDGVNKRLRVKRLQ